MEALPRRAEPRDAEAVFALTREFATSYPVARSSFFRDFPLLLNRSDSVFLVIEIEAEVVGYLLGHQFPTLFAGGPILEILELAVCSSARSKGLGQALVSSAVEEARQRGCVEVVVPTRRAAGFYARFGFAVSAEYLKLKIPT